METAFEEAISGGIPPMMFVAPRPLKGREKK